MTKLLFTICLLATQALLAQTGLTATKRSAWEITFDPVAPVYAKSDARKVLIVRLSNITPQTLWAFEATPLNDYRISVTNTLGKIIPLTAEGHRIQVAQQSHSARTGFFRMPTGWKYDSLMELEPLYALPPGRYVFHATFVSTNQDVAESRTGPRKPGAIDPTGSVTVEITR